jgi:ribosomal protein L7/L12
MIRKLFRLSLREAEGLVDNLPQTFIEPRPYEEATRIAQQLRSTGMVVQIT